MTTYRIVRRAFSKYEVVATFNGTWVDASNLAARMQYENNDGEYFERDNNTPLTGHPSQNGQSGFDYL